MEPLLIINADDYGMSDVVSQAIIDAHRHGVVTSASVMAVGGAFATTAHWLHDVPQLGCGAHLVASGEDRPVLSRREIPTLVDRKGAFPRTWREFMVQLARGRIDADDLRREFRAQLSALVAAGLTLDHVDTHHNLHLWPDIAQVVLDVARDFDIGAIRVVRTHGRSLRGRVVQNLARGVESRLDRSGLVSPDAYAGFDEGGVLDVHTMVRTLTTLRSRDVTSVELAVHPTLAVGSAGGRGRWRSTDQEYRALTSVTVRGAVRDLGFRLGTFAELQPKPRHDQRILDARDRVLAAAGHLALERVQEPVPA